MDRVRTGGLQITIERLNKEIRRRADVVEIFPNPAAFLRLAMPWAHRVVEAHDVWQVTRRCLSGVSMDELLAVMAANHTATALAKQHQITQCST